MKTITKNTKIKNGDRVYISGLIGEDYSHLNNKQCTVQEIYRKNEKGRMTFIAEVQVDYNQYFVNFDYIYSVGHLMNNAEILSLVQEEMPFDYYVKKHNLVDCQPMQDENGQLLAVCKGATDKKHVFLYSGIN